MHDHLCLRIDRGRTAHYLRTGPLVLDVAELAARTGALFDQQPVAAFNQHLDSGRSHADAIFLCLDFLENTDEHR